MKAASALALAVLIGAGPVAAAPRPDPKPPLTAPTAETAAKLAPIAEPETKPAPTVEPEAKPTRIAEPEAKPAPTVEPETGAEPEMGAEAEAQAEAPLGLDEPDAEASDGMGLPAPKPAQTEAGREQDTRADADAEASTPAEAKAEGEAQMEPLGPDEPDAEASDGIGLPAPKPAATADEASDDAAGNAPREADVAPPTRAPPPGCLADLKIAGATFKEREPIAEGQCGTEQPLVVTAVDDVRFEMPAILTCDAALALARWTGHVVRPSARLHLGVDVASIAVSASYVCRGRRTGNGSGGKLSEHAMANAVDIAAVVLTDGRRVEMAPRPGSAAPERAFQAAIRGGACALFTTVLGPGTNALHADHLHLDRAFRSGGYRLCQ